MLTVLTDAFSMDKNNIDNIVNSIGAIAEILWILYDSLLKQGFNEQQSMYLTVEYMVNTFFNTSTQYEYGDDNNE